MHHLNDISFETGSINFLADLQYQSVAGQNRALERRQARCGHAVFRVKLNSPNELLGDVEKLRRAGFHGERFVLPFFTHQYQIPERKYEANRVIEYADDLRKHGVFQMGSVCHGLKRFRKETGDLPVVAQGEIPAGKALGIDVGVFHLLLAASD